MMPAVLSLCVIPHGAPQARKCGTQTPRSLRTAPRIWVPDSRFAASGMTRIGALQ
jgi:hypothetical protein